MSLSAGFKIKGSVITAQPFRDHTYRTQQTFTPVLKYTSQMQHPHHLHGLMRTSSYIMYATSAAVHTE
jgi:hypothetical protein